MHIFLFKSFKTFSPTPSQSNKASNFFEEKTKYTRNLKKRSKNFTSAEKRKKEKEQAVSSTNVGAGKSSERVANNVVKMQAKRRQNNGE